MTAFHEQLAEMAVATRLGDLGTHTLDCLKRTVVDTVGVMVASASEPFAAECVSVCDAMWGVGSGSDECTLIGLDRRVPPGSAAMVNATLGHGFDFDDVHLPALAHLSTVVIPAAMAACEKFNKGGERFLEGVLVGDEVGGRIGWAVCSSEWAGSSIRERGFFPTSVLGTIGAAVAVSKVIGLPTNVTAQAIAISMSLAGGLACISRGDNTTKRTQAGWAAQAGFAAAMMAHEGYTGPRDVLETRQGFLSAFAGNRFHADQFARRKDAPWVCEEMSYKYYPVEYFIHPFIEMAHGARETLRSRLREVTSIEVSTAASIATVFTPIETKASPESSYAALISGPYCIARALTKETTGHLDLSDFRESYVMNGTIQELASKVAFVPDERFDSAFPRHVGGRLVIRSHDKVLWESEMADVYGSLERPMTGADMLEKFRKNCAGWGDEYSEHVLDLLGRVAELPDSSWIAKCGRRTN